MQAEHLEERLAAVRAKRGYLLPHHGLMAVALPGMLEDYDRLYASLALTPRHLDRRDHETVWLALLVAVREPLGTHHLARFREAGGSMEGLTAAVRVAAFCQGAPAWCFVESAWSPHLDDFDARTAYLEAFVDAVGPDGRRLAHLCALAAYAGAGEWTLLGWQLVAAYDDDVPETDMAEALSLVAFPGSVPHFAHACRVWRDLILSGGVEATAPFRAWAAVTGQGGYDEAAGVAKDDRGPGERASP